MPRLRDGLPALGLLTTLRRGSLILSLDISLPYPDSAYRQPSILEEERERAKRKKKTEQLL